MSVPTITIEPSGAGTVTATPTTLSGDQFTSYGWTIAADGTLYSFTASSASGFKFDRFEWRVEWKKQNTDGSYTTIAWTDWVEETQNPLATPFNQGTYSNARDLLFIGTVKEST